MDKMDLYLAIAGCILVGVMVYLIANDGPSQSAVERAEVLIDGKPAPTGILLDKKTGRIYRLVLWGHGVVILPEAQPEKAKP